jgi:hypothetical protein
MALKALLCFSDDTWRGFVYGDFWQGMLGWVRVQLFPKFIYRAAAVTHSLQKLENVFKSIWYKLLPSLHVNRNITKEYRMLLLRF